MYKKIVLFIIFVFLFTCTAGSVVAAKPVITADTTYYDANTGLYVLKGHVHIKVGSRVITAGQAKVSLGSLEIWGLDGITLTQDNIQLTAGSVHIYGTRSKAMLSGGVTLSQPHITITADAAEFNWRTKLAPFTGNVHITQGDDTWSAASITYNIKTGELE